MEVQKAVETGDPCNQTVGSRTSASCDTHISPEASSCFSGKRVAYGDSQGSAELAPWLTTVKRSYWSGGGQCWYHIQILTQSTASIHDSLASFAFPYKEPEIPEDVCSPPHSPLLMPKTLTQWLTGMQCVPPKPLTLVGTVLRPHQSFPTLKPLRSRPCLTDTLPTPAPHFSSRSISLIKQCLNIPTLFLVSALGGPT